MKKLLFSAMAVLAVTSSLFAQPQVKKVADVAKFDNDAIDFGKVLQSLPPDHLHPAKGTFTFTNISNAPLIIELAQPTCGCTISDYTKEPIAPGKTGVINATYNALNVGQFNKTLFVKFAGIDEKKPITFTGEVLTEADYNKLKGTTSPSAAVTPAATATPSAATTTTAPVKTKKAKAKKLKAAPATATSAS